MSIEEARGVRNGVAPCTGNNSMEEECQECLRFRLGIGKKNFHGKDCKGLALPWAVVESPSMEMFKAMWMWHLGSVVKG